MSQQYISLLTQEKTKLESWGLPKNILENYEQLGIRSMFPWQVECLSCQGVLAGKNLVYSAPTSAGKTMIAEMLTIKTVLEKKKKVLIILPFISVVREKMIYFQTLLSSSGVRVAGFMGSHAPPGGMKSVHIGVCTIEKANSLINRMLEDQGLENIGCIVVDELHLLGDPNRGYLLELLLTKIKYMCQKDPLLSIQIVGMSATLPNLIDLANWLNAALYTTDFRPVPLKEYLKVDLKILNAPDLSVKCTLQPSISIKNDKGNIIYLCLETLLNGHSVLVFCHTRSWCEASALQIAQSIQQLGNEKSDVGAKLRNQLNSNEIYELLQQLKNCPAGLDSTLGHCVAFGVAFHHAGLTMDERDILEGAFRNSVIRVLVATSTLSSGVNLPARRVLIRCPTPGRELDILAYRQMVGRAGRMGKDTAGESFLICSATEQHIGKLLVTSDLPPVKSCLDSRDLSASLKRAILEVVASGVVCSLSEVDQYTKCTLFSSIGCIKRESDISNPISVCIQFLQMNEFLRIDGESLYPTPLAEACLSASLPPDQGLKLLKELHRARQCFVLETELHVIYQVTPYSVSEQWSQLDWLHVFNLWEELPISMKRVGELVGIEERFLVSAMRGTINMKSSSQLQLLSIHRRFYTALALQDLVNEVSLSEVATKFKCSKGMLQSLQQSASTFAGMVTQFSRRLGWSSVELLVGQFCARLQFGVHRELLDLLRLDCLSPVYARALYNAGLTGLPDLAIASATKIEKALMKAVPFESDNKEPFGDNDGKKQRRLWLVGRRAATEAEAAALLIHEARDLLEAELGLVKAQWDSTSTATSSNSREQVLSSDSFLSSETQSLNSPSQLIGKLVVNKENSPHQVSESLGISDNKDSVQSKQNISMKMLSSAQESNEQHKRNNNPSVKNTSKCTENEKGNGENVELFNSPNQETQNANEKKLICNTVDKLIQNHDVNSNSANTTYRMIDLQSTSIILQQANIQNERKRESFDLFDSPNLSLSDHESKISVNSATNIKIDHSKLQETESQVSLHESNIVPNDFNELVKDLTFLDVPSNTSINSKKFNEIEKHNQSTLKLVKSEKEFIDKDIISDLSLLNHDDTVFGEIYFSTPENVKTDIEVKKTRSSFNLFDSPNSFTFLGNLDALNIDDTCDLDLIDSNVGGDSILEMSSRKVEKSYRKRKRDSNFEEKNIKRVKRCRIAEVSSIIGDHNVISDDLEIKTKENTEEFTQNKIMQSVQYNNIALENEDSLNKNRSLFQSSLNIDTQLCGLLDTGKKEEHNKQLDFKLETQVELKKLNLSNIVFDEDIVFGTPEQKTTYQNTLERCSLTNNKINKDYIKCSKSNLKSGYSVSHQKDSTINLKNKGHAIDETIDVDHEQNKYEVHCFTHTVENLRHSHSNQTILNTPIQVRKHEIKTDFGVPQNKYSFGTPFQISKHKIIPVKSNLGNSQLCQTDSLNILQKRKETDIKELETSYAEENCETPIERTQRYKHKIIVAESQLGHSQTSWRTFRTHQQQKEQEFIKDVENLPLNTFCKSSTKICDNELMISKSDLSISKKTAEIVCNGSDYINCFKCTYPEASKGNTCDTDSISLVYLTNKNQLTINENEKYLHSDIVKEFSKEFHEEEISNKTNKSKICPKDILGIESTDSINTNKLPIKTNNLSSEENFMTDQNVLERCNQEIADKFLIKQVDNDCGSKTNLYRSGCNGPVTDSFLECAFKSTFLQNEFSIKRIEINENQEILKKEEKMLEEEEREMLEEEEEKILEEEEENILEEDEDEEDYIASSQETNVTPMKSFRTYSRNDKTKTPQHPHGIETPDVKNRNVIIIDELTCKQFEKDVLTQKELAFALDIRNGNDGCLIKEGIGSKILKHQTEEDKSKYQFKDNTVLGFVLTWGGNTVYHLDLHNNAVGNITILKNILQRKTCSIIIWDWKRTIKTLYECCQISVFAQGRDPVVAEWLLNPQSTLGSLKQLAMKHDIKIPKCSNKLQFDVSLLWDVHRILKKKLKQAELYKSYVGVEMPVQSILAAMELTGMSWDSDYASLVWSHVETKMTELQELAYLICNKKFNLGSRTDVSKIKATLKKCYDDEEPHIFLEVLQKWRKLRFMKSQNLSPLLLLGGRRLHGQCYTHTATGRISIFEPNLQNIPRDINIDDDVISLRSAFTTKPGNVLIAADFCQLELRILAHLSQDRNLLTHLNNPGDVFITIAADWNKINLDQVMDDTRHQTKQLCYGLIYGMGFKSLAKEMEVTEVQAEEMSRKFKQSYPGLEKYMKTCIDECKSKGYVTTLMGRRRFLPQINSGNKSHKAQAERQAVNTTVQGSAADIAKIAMIKIEKALFRLPKRDITITSSCTAHLVLQLHDELIYEVNNDISNEVCNIIRQKMEECVKLSVPLPVKVRKGCSWGQLETVL